MPTAFSILKFAVLILLAKVLISILSNYPDYFPPNFQSDFLIDRQSYFLGWYQVAFYIHILVTPLTLVSGTILISESIRKRFSKQHRLLGRIHVAAIVLLVVPSSLWMAFYAYSGSFAITGFAILAILTGFTAAKGWQAAVNRRYTAHRRWMMRCYLLLCSAVVLRLIAGLAIIMSADPVLSYQFAAWASWIIPLAIFEVLQRYRVSPRSVVV